MLGRDCQRKVPRINLPVGGVVCRTFSLGLGRGKEFKFGGREEEDQNWKAHGKGAAKGLRGLLVKFCFKHWLVQCCKVPWEVLVGPWTWPVNLSCLRLAGLSQDLSVSSPSSACFCLGTLGLDLIGELAKAYLVPFNCKTASFKL